MSDLLTHWAVFEDCRRLSAQDPQIEPVFTQALQQECETARLGALSRGGNSWVPAVLTRQRETAAHGPPDLRKLAFALGGITHYAADVVMKPLMSRLAGADWSTTDGAMQKSRDGTPRTDGARSIREISAYYDCHVFREVYRDGAESPFDGAAFLLSANATEPGRALETFVRALFQRALLAWHTLSPAKADIDGWLDRLFAKLQPLYISLDLYARVYVTPDPAKLTAYEVATTFYRSDDPLIRLARRVQLESSAAPGELDAALTPAANASAYAAAVALGLVRLREASAFWQHRNPAPPDLRQ